MSGTESRLQQIKARCEALVETMIWASRNVHPVEPAAFLADQVRRLAASCADLCEVLLDSGLLDQAGSGDLNKHEAPTNGSPATVPPSLDQANEGSGEVQRIASVMNPSISDEGLGSTVPHPTPASVIREFMRVERGGDSPTGWTGDPFLDVDAMATEIVRLRSSPAPESVEGVLYGEVFNHGIYPHFLKLRLDHDVNTQAWPIGTKVRIQRISE